MFIKITLIIVTALVAINFLLLVFSCNKTTKRKTKKIKAKSITKQQQEAQLAPTGS